MTQTKPPTRRTPESNDVILQKTVAMNRWIWLNSYLKKKWHHCLRASSNICLAFSCPPHVHPMLCKDWEKLVMSTENELRNTLINAWGSKNKMKEFPNFKCSKKSARMDGWLILHLSRTISSSVSYENDIVHLFEAPHQQPLQTPIHILHGMDAATLPPILPHGSRLMVQQTSMWAGLDQSQSAIVPVFNVSDVPRLQAPG